MAHCNVVSSSEVALQRASMVVAPEHLTTYYLLLTAAHITGEASRAVRVRSVEHRADAPVLHQVAHGIDKGRLLQVKALLLFAVYEPVHVAARVEDRKEGEDDLTQLPRRGGGGGGEFERTRRDAYEVTQGGSERGATHEGATHAEVIASHRTRHRQRKTGSM